MVGRRSVTRLAWRRVVTHGVKVRVIQIGIAPLQGCLFSRARLTPGRRLGLWLGRRRLLLGTRCGRRGRWIAAAAVAPVAALPHVLPTEIEAAAEAEFAPGGGLLRRDTCQRQGRDAHAKKTLHTCSRVRTSGRRPRRQGPPGAGWPSIADERNHGGRPEANCVKESERAAHSKAHLAASASCAFFPQVPMFAPREEVRQSARTVRDLRKLRRKSRIAVARCARRFTAFVAPVRRG